METKIGGNGEFAPSFPFSPSLTLSSSHPLTLILLLFLTACANPRIPPGGPPDRTPPALLASTPAADSVNVETGELRLTFSEWVDEASFSRAFSITPTPAGRLEFDWRRRSVTIRFPEPLRDSTTYVVTLDTNLRDARGVALSQPIVLAFSTGPEINRGRLAGEVLDPVTGEGIAGIDVYAYALPDSTPPAVLPEHPAYRSQTDDAGRFELSYLNERPYFVVALQDQNRNRRPDATERFAVPPQPALVADTTLAEPLPRWLVTARDTIPPEPQRVRTLSSRRLTVRFSESVHLVERDPEAWRLEDTLSSTPAQIRSVYMQSGDTRQVYLRTDSLPAIPHHLTPAAVADSSGNLVLQQTLRFTPEAEADTLQLRFEGFQPPADTSGIALLPPREVPALLFNQPPGSSSLAAALTARDTTGAPLSIIPTTTNGTTYRLSPDQPFLPGFFFDVRLDGPTLGLGDTLYAQRYQRLPESMLGDLSGYVTTEDTTGTLVVQLYRGEERTPYATAATDATGYFIFRTLPEGTYRYRAFLDRDGDGTWDAGRLVPYMPPEPVTWSNEPLAWRARWESAPEDTLRILSRF